jgi:hypothetical protein
MRIRELLKLSSALTGMVCAVAPAIAATVTNVNSTITNAGTCVAVSGCPENYLLTSVSGATQTVNVPPPGSFGFTDSFNQAGNVSTGSNFGNAATGSGAPWNFQDNILFTTNGAAVQAQAIAQLGNVSNLQIRIISLGDPNNGGSAFDVSSPSAAAALLGGGSVVTIQNGWTNFVQAPLNIDYAATLLNPVASGSYILQIRGEAAAGSSYAGTISFTPVPLPASWVMLMSGLGLLGLAMSMRRGRAPDVKSAVVAA